MRKIKTINQSVIFVIIFGCLFFRGTGFSQSIQSSESVKDIADYYLSIINNAKDSANITLMYSGSEEKVYRESGIKEVYTFYDLKGTPTAYLFATENTNGELGYIAISSTTSFLPLLSSSSNSHPMENFDECFAKACAIDPSTCQDKDDYHPIYLGLFYFFFVFNPNSDTPVVVEAMTKSIVPYDLLLYMQGKYNIAKMRSASSTITRWKNLRSGRKLSLSNLKTENISNLPVYNWYRGCTTTTSTMILSYYGLVKGYEGLDEDPDDFQWTRPTGWIFDWLLWGCQEYPSDIHIPKDIADELADEMGISENCGLFTNFGAYSYQQANATETVAQNHGCFFEANLLDPSAISTYMSEIDAGRPAAIIYNVLVYGDPNFDGGHSVAGWGYTEVSATEHILYFNTTWDDYPSRNSFTYETAYVMGYMWNFISLIPTDNLPVVPDIKANGSDQPLVISQGEPLIITLSLDPGGYADENADWWFATFYYVDQTTIWPVFVDGSQAPLFNFGPEDITLDTSVFPEAIFIFFFAVDMNMNGLYDSDQAFYDFVPVIIQ